MITQNKRKGYTKITSVSVTDEMLKLIEEHDLSPTEVFRRGMGVSLHDLGISPFSLSIMNKERSDYIKHFISMLEEAELLNEFNSSLNVINSFNLKLLKTDEAVYNITRILKKLGVTD